MKRRGVDSVSVGWRRVVRSAWVPSAALALLVAFAPPTASHAQSNEFTHQYQTWLAANVHGPLTEDWYLQGDVQYRAFEDVTPQALLVRASLLHRLRADMFLGAGYAWQPTWRSRGLRDYVDDHRIYEQWQWEVVDAPSGLRMQLRTRFEQRLRHPTSTLEFGLRARQLLRFVLPVDSARRFMFILWDELFVNFMDSGGSPHGTDETGAIEYTPRWAHAGFDQNRVFFGVGFQLEPGVARLEVGYQNQWFRRPQSSAGDLMGHTGLVSLVLHWSLPSPVVADATGTR